MKYLVHQFEDELLLSNVETDEGGESWYLLIGTISSGAIWLKHGDFIEKEDFRVEMECPECSLRESGRYLCDCPNIFQPKVYVKCPCCNSFK